MERIDYRIEGLDCAEEVAALKKVLHGKKDVLSLDFDISKITDDGDIRVRPN